ncbi:MAG: hypothetical protein WDZ43_00765 [Nitrosopumilaceae archaeon]
MSQTAVTFSEKQTWVLVSSLKQNTKEEDLKRIAPSIIDLIDEWHAVGKFIWSGPFNDNKTGMAIFEGTEDEAKGFYDKYDKICSGVLDYYIYKWDALPFLSIL